MQKAWNGLAAVTLSALLVPPAASAAERWIEIILDVSGSMNARLAAGPTRIEAARTAFATVLENLPADANLAFRAYGHQSHREKHDCRDTQLLVPFGPLADVREQVAAMSRTLTPRGYTPITYVMQTAAADFPAGAAGERVLILVSDGKETCEGDPCAAARALKAAHANLVVHTIGFDVDVAARYQLKCVADRTGGTYTDVANAEELAKALGSAAVAPMGLVPIPGTRPGNLTVKRASLRGHRVLEAESGKEVGTIDSLKSTIRVPAGVYNVTFGTGLWKSVVVESDKPTVLEPAVLEIRHASPLGHKILDSETGSLQGEVSSMTASMTLLPGVYDVTFGGAAWTNLKCDGGRVTTLEPGILRVTGATYKGHMVRDSTGTVVAELSQSRSSFPLPPGEYTIEVPGRRLPVAIQAGVTRDVNVGSPR